MTVMTTESTTKSLKKLCLRLKSGVWLLKIPKQLLMKWMGMTEAKYYSTSFADGRWKHILMWMVMKKKSFLNMRRKWLQSQRRRSGKPLPTSWSCCKHWMISFPLERPRRKRSSGKKCSMMQIKVVLESLAWRRLNLRWKTSLERKSSWWSLPSRRPTRRQRVWTRTMTAVMSRPRSSESC